MVDTTRLWQSSRLSQYISCFSSLAYPLTKRIVRKASSFSTVIINKSLPFKRALLVESMNIPSISVFVKVQITHAVTEFFQRQGLVRSIHTIVAVQNYQCVSTWLFCAFSWPKNKVKIRFRTQLRQCSS